MTELELRAKIRALMASGDLPSEAPSIERRGSDESAPLRLTRSCPGALPSDAPLIARSLPLLLAT